jgi:8-oxo-dGTP pyrophosphatase MutT (NUDIX family)
MIREQVRAIATRASCVPAAVLVPLVERDGDLTVLLTQRAATLKDHAGQISFPGGRIEPGRCHDPWRAALREAHEEIGSIAKHSWNSPDTCRITGSERAFA